MEEHDIVFQRSFGDWAVSIFMLLLPLPLFWFFYPRAGFENGNKELIYLMFIALSLFLYGFYRTFLAPYSLQFQTEGFLVIKSVLFPKIVAIAEIQSVQITENEGGKGPLQSAYALLLKDGDPIDIPALPRVEEVIEIFKTQYPSIEIKDGRSN